MLKTPGDHHSQVAISGLCLVLQTPKKLQGLQKKVGKAADAAPAAFKKALPKGIPQPGLPQRAQKAADAVKTAAPSAPKLPSGIPIPGLPSKVSHSCRTHRQNTTAILCCCMVTQHAKGLVTPLLIRLLGLLQDTISMSAVGDTPIDAG